MSYKTANTMIHFPKLVRADTGIHSVTTLAGRRYRVWWVEDGVKRYVSLPPGIGIEEARERRDRLYQRLKADYGASRKTLRTSKGRPKVGHSLDVTPGKFIYRRDPFVVRIRGVQVGTASTLKTAEAMRDRWLAKHGFKTNAEVRHGASGADPT